MESASVFPNRMLGKHWEMGIRSYDSRVPSMRLRDAIRQRKKVRTCRAFQPGQPHKWQALLKALWKRMQLQVIHDAGRN